MSNNKEEFFFLICWVESFCNCNIFCNFKIRDITVHQSFKVKMNAFDKTESKLITQQKQ